MLKGLFLLMLLMLSGTTFAQNLITLNAQNALILQDYVYERSVNQLLQKAQTLDTMFPDAGPIYLVLFTGGGSIDDGLDLVNGLRGLSRPVHTITIHAYSMGFITAQMLGTRYITQTGDLMSHRASGWFGGSFPGEAVSRMKFWLKRINHIDQQVAARAKLTLKAYKSLVHDEYWCTGQDCIKDGFADKVADMRCDHSLNGTETNIEKIPLGLGMKGVVQLVITTTFAKCPISPGASNVEFSVTEALDSSQSKRSERIIDFFEDRGQPSPKSWLVGSPFQ